MNFKTKRAELRSLLSKSLNSVARIVLQAQLDLLEEISPEGAKNFVEREIERFIESLPYNPTSAFEKGRCQGVNQLIGVLSRYGTNIIVLRDDELECVQQKRTWDEELRKKLKME